MLSISFHISSTLLCLCLYFTEEVESEQVIDEKININDN
jgi:hypothetical protein